jgi:hypothetical protein
MYRQLDMLNNADSTEYGRMMNAFDTTSAYRDRRYDEAYTQFRDTKSDAFNMANLQLSEHGQLANDALNLFNASSSYADSMYQKEYTKWADEVNQAMQYGQMLNNDYWQQTTFDEDVRQYEKDFAEEQRQYDTSFAEEQRQYDTSFAEEQRQFDKTYEQTEKWNQADMDYRYDALEQDDTHFNKGLEHESSENQKDRDWKTEDREDNQAWQDTNREDEQKWQDSNREDNQAWQIEENQKDRNVKTSGDTTSEVLANVPESVIKQASKFENDDDLNAYLAERVNKFGMSEEEADYLFYLYAKGNGNKVMGLISNVGGNLFRGLFGK